MRVSVVMAAFNAEAFLHGAYRSVCAQTLPAAEIVVVDDASTDRTASLVQRLAARDGRVRLLRAPCNAGPAAARNLALEAATGDWLAVMDCDDFMHPARLEATARVAEAHGADVVLDNAVLLDPAGFGAIAAVTPPHGDAVTLDLASYLRRIMWGRNHVGIGILKPVLRREWLLRSGVRYREHLRHGEDSFLMLDCLRGGARVVLSPQPTYFYTMAVSVRTKARSPASRTDKTGIDVQIAELRKLRDEMRGRGLPLRRAVRALEQSRCSILLRRAVRGRNPRLLRSLGVLTLAQTGFFIARERRLRSRARRMWGRRPEVDALVAGFRGGCADGG